MASECVSLMKDACEKKHSGEPVPLNIPVARGLRNRASFVMTLWLEGAEDTTAPEWRWRVVHVQGKQETYFTRLADVLNYVSEQAGIAPPC